MTRHILSVLYIEIRIMGFWRNIYEIFGWEYISKNDPCPRQRHLKYLCCKEIKHTDTQRMLMIIGQRRRYVLIYGD
jgi:hypothetical protein